MRWKTLATTALLVVACTMLARTEQRLYAQFASVARDTGVFLTPDQSRTPLVMLRKGTMVKVVRRDGDWVNVQFRDERFGYRAGFALASDLVFSRGGDAEPAEPGSNGSPSDGAAAAPPAAEAPRRDATADPDPNAPLRARTETVIVYATFSEEDIARAIEAGRLAPGRTHGVLVSDARQASLPAPGTPASAAEFPGATRIELFTALQWIKQLASDAAREQRPFGVSDVPPDALEPVLRVVIYPEGQASTTSTINRGVAAIEHVVLRDESTRVVVQPLHTEIIEGRRMGALGNAVLVPGLRATFHLNDIYDLRGADGARDFFVTVVDSAGREKNVRILLEHFAAMP